MPTHCTLYYVSMCIITMLVLNTNTDHLTATETEIETKSRVSGANNNWYPLLCHRSSGTIKDHDCNLDGNPIHNIGLVFIDAHKVVYHHISYGTILYIRLKRHV